MRNTSEQDCLSLRQALNASHSLAGALSKTIGETQIGGGLWRFFSAHYPNGGVAEWNSHSTWKSEWDRQPSEFYAFGEDVFGNQLVLQTGVEQVLLWNHENGDMTDLLLEPVTLIETVVHSGLSWIDFYNDGALMIAEKRLIDVPPECHLHWTRPLILGGQVSTENTSVVERTQHLIGHAKLWKQVRGCDPGTIVIPIHRPKR